MHYPKMFWARRVTLIIVFSVAWLLLCHFGNSSNDTSHEQFFNYCRPNLLLVHPNASHRSKVWYILHPNIYVMNIVMDD